MGTATSTGASTATATGTGTGRDRKIKVVVATSVMLTFISFWRAAAIVLNDLGSSAFYAAGIAEQAIGASAPWFILGVMLFSYCVRSVYVESCSMFTRGGVYRVVKTAMGPQLAKLSVSALMFDYILTGPISAVSAGQYIVGLVAQTMTYFGHTWVPDKDTINLVAAGIAVLITIYFWWRNTKGVHESSGDALKIMYVVTAMIILMIGWSTITIAMKPEAQRLPPSPTAHHLTFNRDAVGWLPRLIPDQFRSLRAEAPPAATIVGDPPAGEDPEAKMGLAHNVGLFMSLVGIMIAFGHSFLAMSGEESLAQVNRELEYPKHKNLMRAGLVIFVYSLVFTSLVSFFAYAIIPDHLRANYNDNLIAGIAMFLVGPEALRLIFQAFIVVVGFLMLAGAVNTAIIGANGVLNRVSEDGVLTDWFRAPHKKFGTSYRIINMIVIFQLITIVGSRGNVYTLGEAYAFGVIWSFAFKALAMFLLRFKDKSPREWRVPFNLKIDGWEIPIGLGLIAMVMFAVAGINLFTKEVATISGLLFTITFFIIFHVSEVLTIRARAGKEHISMDQFTLAPRDELDEHQLQVRPGNILCLVRDFQTLQHVSRCISLVDTQQQDLVVMTVHRLTGPDSGYENIHTNELFTDYEQRLFSKVVSIAEKEGKTVQLLVVPSSNVFQAIAISAAQLKSAEIIAGRSSVMTPEEQARRMGEAWEQVPDKPGHIVRFRVIDSDGQIWTYALGAHAPDLSRDDLQLIHDFWLDLVKEPGLEGLRHNDVVMASVRRLRGEFQTDKSEVVASVRAYTKPNHET